MESIFPHLVFVPMFIIIIIFPIYIRCVYDFISTIGLVCLVNCHIEYEALPSGLCRTTLLRCGLHPVYSILFYHGSTCQYCPQQSLLVLLTNQATGCELSTLWGTIISISYCYERLSLISVRLRYSLLYNEIRSDIHQCIQGVVVLLFVYMG